MNTVKRAIHIISPSLLALLPGVAAAQDGLSSGNTAWMLTATALVFSMFRLNPARCPAPRA